VTIFTRLVEIYPSARRTQELYSCKEPHLVTRGGQRKADRRPSSGIVPSHYGPRQEDFDQVSKFASNQQQENKGANTRHKDQEVFNIFWTTKLYFSGNEEEKDRCGLSIQGVNRSYNKKSEPSIRS
jgi:hypothetical protein